MKALFSNPKIRLIAMLLTLITGCNNPQTQTKARDIDVSTESVIKPNAEFIRRHMSYLASDELEGREAGTTGYDKAANYVATEFEKLGLQAKGDNDSYFQEVPLRRSYRNKHDLDLKVKTRSGEPLELKESSDFLVNGSLNSAEANITADVVFVGFGLVAPELGRDDYKGLDVKGKIVAVLSRTPDGIQSEERAYYGSLKTHEASKRGAVGMVSLYTPAAEAIYSFRRRATEGALDAARMGWIQKNGEIYSRSPNLKVSATLSLAGAEKLFADAPTSWQDILKAAAKDGGKTPTFQLPVSMTIKQTSTLSETRSANVIGVIPGSDPELKNEVLVLSGHLDHIGISNTVEKDRINNGALDNAAGIATLIETARLLMQQTPPKRTILFLANTAEEKGLLGSQYFVKNQTLLNHKIVANINLDMPVLTYDFTDVIVFGGERSSINAAIRSAAKQMGIAIAKDPFPEQGIFTRSDHFRFVEQGIPAVMLATGMANGGEKAWAQHFAKNYHRPSDDMNNNINFDAAAKFAELKTRITLQVANADKRPLWNKNDFFAKNFDGPMATQ